MSPRPTGRLLATPAGNDLILERQFEAPIEDVWTSVTASESTARWIGAWSGEPGAGNTVQFQMGFEKDTPVSDVLIEVCEAPHRLAVSMNSGMGEWRMELLLSQTGSTTTLRFIQHAVDPAMVGDIGPGWEYYLDMLVAARAGAPLPPWDDYYPAQREHFLSQL